MKSYIILIPVLLFIFSCSEKSQDSNQFTQPVYQDTPFVQDYAVKYHLDSEAEFKKVFTDRNGVTQVLTDKGLFRPTNGHLQYPGTLEQDITYIPMKDKGVLDIAIYQDQFIYLDDTAVFSNAWAGKLFARHNFPEPELVVGGKDFTFLVTSHERYWVLKDSEVKTSGSVDARIVDAAYDEGAFYLLTEQSVFSLDEKSLEKKSIYSGNQMTAFDVTGDQIAIGTNDGFLILHKSGKVVQPLNTKLPWPEITAIQSIDGKRWFGSTKGAYMLKEDGKFNYYFGKRWLPGNEVIHISTGPDNSVMILTDKGLGQICFKMMTLEEKAMFYEKQVRERHVRYGIITDKSSLKDHRLSTARNRVAASDNLWTGMYLGSQLFRYLVTGSEDAKQNCYESFEAMERLHEINDIKGLFGRSFERRGYYPFRKEYRSYVENYWYEGYNNTVSWYHAEDPEWDWKSTASSDQTVGQMFALMLVAEYIDDEAWRQRAIKLIDDLMGYIVENDYTLVDPNGKPTLWGIWGPEYVNRFQTMIGDRKVYSSNLIAFLQAAYKFTGKEIYKDKATELIREHGYLENLARPFDQIGNAPEGSDPWSTMLSEEWNHSDDEMYFLAYWGLYPYAFADSLKPVYKEAIRDHWQHERPEKNSLWNFCYAMTGAEEFDLEESVWHLKEFPLDMIEYETINSHRKDLVFREDPGFRGQYIEEVLPPDERPDLKHNKNLFNLDAGNRNGELSAGDTYLLPYWMGRFLGVISAPEE
ncbi:MAG: hypothetical protein RLO17_09095 [Cyclobacteriaceae bacterium]